MDRSAEDREWSSLHYGGEGVWFPPYRTKVCGRTGREGAFVSQGDLPASLIRVRRGITQKESQTEALEGVGGTNGI